MISLAVVVILLVVGVFAIKMNHLKHRFFIIMLVLLALFLYTTIYVVNSKNNLEITSVDGAFNAGKVYLGWLANGFGNLKDLTGRAIGMDWTSTNKSFSESLGKDDGIVKKISEVDKEIKFPGYKSKS